METTMMEGRMAEQKEAPIQRLSGAAAEEPGWALKEVRTVIYEVPRAPCWSASAGRALKVASRRGGPAAWFPNGRTAFRRLWGYEPGLLSPAKQEQIGVDTPIHGRVYPEMILESPVDLGAFIGRGSRLSGGGPGGKVGRAGAARTGGRRAHGEIGNVGVEQAWFGLEHPPAAHLRDETPLVHRVPRGART